MKRLIAASIFLLACNAEQYSDDAEALVETPDAFSVASEGEQRIGFCSDFGDPALDNTVEVALQQNFDLRGAWARLEQSQAISKQANASLFPTVTADASAGRTRTQGFTGPAENNQFQVSVGAAYELDLWGRLHHNRKAAKNDIEASRADFETINISVANQVFAAWFDVAAAREKRALLENQLQISESFLELTLLRLKQGSANALDVTQQRQQVESLRGQSALNDASEKIALHQLAILTARAPTSAEFETSASLPDLPPTPAVGVPADLLDNRPDVRSALLRLKSADHRTKAAIAQALPSIRLSANVFLQAANIGDLVDEIFWSVSGLVSQTIFGGGRIQAEKSSAEAAARAQLYTFGQTYLRALKEVEDALILGSQQALFIESLEKQLQDARTGLDLARERYAAGAGTYFRVLTSLQTVQQLEQARVDAKRTELNYRLSLCRALGGQWVKRQNIETSNQE